MLEQKRILYGGVPRSNFRLSPPALAAWGLAFRRELVNSVYEGVLGATDQIHVAHHHCSPRPRQDARVGAALGPVLQDARILDVLVVSMRDSLCE